MNGFAWEGKRAHWAFVGVMRRLFDREAARVKHRRSVLTGMTAARYDLLHAVYRRNQWMGRLRPARPVIPFGELVKKLGLAVSTVSRAVMRMEEIGWLRRFTPDHDRRATVVAITTLGVKTFHAAQRAVRFAFDACVRAVERVPRSLACDLNVERGDAPPADPAFLMDMYDRVALVRYIARWFGSVAHAMYAPGYVEGYPCTRRAPLRVPHMGATLDGSQSRSVAR